MYGERAAADRAVVNTVPRSAPGLIASTFALYRRYSWLFLALAALVVIPYNLIFLAATGFGRLEDSSLAEAAGLSLLLLEIGLLTPLVSALHVHAVVAIRAGEQLRIGAVTRLGLAALPVVVAASLIAWLGIFVGFIALIVPGVYLLLRWFVVAQAAAIEREGWSDALERSATLVSGNYLHVFVLALIVFGIGFVFEFLGGHAFGDSTGAVSFLASIVVQVLVWSFTALATALLYFDLRARRQRSFAQGLTEPPADEDPVLAEKPFDAVDAAWGAGSYSDEERPPGWYVDPTTSNRLRYWGGDPPGWGKSIRMSPKMRRGIRGKDEEGKSS